MNPDEDPPDRGVILPLAVATYQQPPQGKRLAVPSGGRTRPGNYYLLAQYEKGGPCVVHSGPYAGFNAMQEALKAVPLRPAEY